MRLHTLPLVLSAVLLGSALASCAQAHQSDEGETKTASATRQSFSYQSTDGDGRSVELRIEDGRVAVAKVDGKDIAAERVRKVPDGFDIVAEDGSVMRHVAVVRADARRGGEKKAEERKVVRADAKVDAKAGARSSAKPDARDDARMRPRAAGPDVARQDPPREMAQPKSMIGLALAEPDAALAHHLGIDPAKSTMVANVVEGLPADKAGLERFDVIAAVNGDGDASPENLRRVLRDCEPGKKVTLDVVRGSKRKKVSVTAVEFDGRRMAMEADPQAPIEVQGRPLRPENGPRGGEDVFFFMGPDGQPREMQVPMMPGMRGMTGGPAEMERFERMMEDRFRRMEEQPRRGEDQPGRAEPRMRAPGPGGPRGEQGGRANQNPVEERLRRLEQRVDQLMRELERARGAERDTDRERGAERKRES